GRAGAAPPQGVRAAGPAARERRSGPDPRPAHRPRLGRRLRGRHQDPRRARQAPPLQGRGGPVQPHPHRHHPRPGLQVRGPPGLIVRSGPACGSWVGRRVRTAAVLLRASASGAVPGDRRGPRPAHLPRRLVRVSPPTYATETPRDPTRPWAPSPFRRLAKTHALSVAGDAIFTTTIAGLVFFNVSDLN